MIRLYSLLLAGTLLYASAVSAGDNDAKGQKATDIENVRAELVKMIPAASNAEIVETPAAGVYRLEVQGNFAYAYVEGDFVLIGDLYNTSTRENLGDLAQATFLKSELSNYEDKMIVFGPEDAKHRITVFTDVTCYYCQKLHQEVSELTDAGIQVRYLIWPRGGIGSDGFNKNLAVWCNKDQQKAMTDAKAGRSVPSATCENPIADTFAFGRKAGVSGTPMILFEDGTRQPGYLPSAQLIAQVIGSQAGAE